MVRHALTAMTLITLVALPSSSSAESFDFAGHHWTRTDDAIRGDGWIFDNAIPGDRFFLVTPGMAESSMASGLESVGEIDGMRVLRLSPERSIDIPHALGFHEILPHGITCEPESGGSLRNDPGIQEIVDEVDSNSLYTFDYDLSSILTRYCNSAYYEVAADYAATVFDNHGWAVESQYFDFGGQSPTRNVIATKEGVTSPDSVIVLCAHLDSITYDSFGDPNAPAPGADDNGSSSSAVLEAARIFETRSFRMTVKLVLFGAEELGLYGSYYFAEQAAQEGMNIVCAVNADMIAYDDDGTDDAEIICNNNSEWIADLMLASAATYTSGVDFEKTLDPNSHSSDHRAFWDLGFTSTWLFEGWNDYSQYIHSDQDLISTLNFPFFVECTKLLLATTAELAGMVAPLDAPTGGAPVAITLRHYPEPATTSIAFLINGADDQLAHIRVFDVRGRLTADLGAHRLAAGTNRLTWDGRVQAGGQAAPGVYFVRVSSPGATYSDRITIIE